jgi:hypothetical protein
VFFFFLLFLSTRIFADSTVPMNISSDHEIATAGYFQLSWGVVSNRAAAVTVNDYIVQKSTTPGFQDATVLYEGSETASLISGMKNGEYFFRVRRKDQAEWSKPVRVQVIHHSIGTAMQFFLAGLLVFLVTLVVIVKGARQHKV